MAEKKYYWLKMTDQFFEDKAIKKLRKISRGRYLHNHLSENAADGN